VRPVCNRQALGIPAVVRIVVAEAHPLAAFPFLADEPDARAAAQSRDERQIVLAPLHHEAALSIGSVQLEFETRENLVELVFPQDLLDDLGNAHVEEEPALRRIAQQRQTRFQHDLVQRLIAVGGLQREARHHALHAPRLLRPAPSVTRRRLNDECTHPVQKFTARQVVTGMGEPDRVLRRLADPTLAIEFVDVRKRGSGRALDIQAIELMDVDARARGCVGNGRARGQLILRKRLRISPRDFNWVSDKSAIGRI